MGWVNQQANNVSSALGTDGSGGGLAGEISNIGRDIANDPILSAAISAGAAYFGVPPALTATLLGANKAGQKGDLTAGLTTGLGSYGVGTMTNSAFGTFGGSAAPTTVEAGVGAVEGAPAAADAATAAAPGAPVSAAPSVPETLVERSAGALDKVTSAGSNVVDNIMSVGGKAVDKIAALGGKAGTALMAAAEKNPLMAAQLVASTVGGMYTSSENRASAEANRKAAAELQASRLQAEVDSQNRYNSSFNLGTMSRAKGGPLRRLDGSLVYTNGKMNVGT